MRRASVVCVASPATNRNLEAPQLCTARHGASRRECEFALGTRGCHAMAVAETEHAICRVRLQLPRSEPARLGRGPVELHDAFRRATRKRFAQGAKARPRRRAAELREGCPALCVVQTEHDGERGA